MHIGCITKFRVDLSRANKQKPICIDITIFEHFPKVMFLTALVPKRVIDPAAFVDI